MLVNRIKFPITSLGPEKRIVIWTMGCSHGCYNCIAPNLWEFDKSYERSIDSILEEIISYGNHPITISGGDPFMQKDLSTLLKRLKELNYHDILVYTGYTYEYLLKDEKLKESLNYIDVLIDGKYIDSLNDNLPLRGSSNQRIIFLNKNLIHKYEKVLEGEREFQIEYKDGLLNIYGIVPKGFLNSYEEILKKKNVNKI